MTSGPDGDRCVYVLRVANSMGIRGGGDGLGRDTKRVKDVSGGLNWVWAWEWGCKV